MLIDLPIIWTIGLNVALWPIVQLALAWGFTRMRSRWFERPCWSRFPGESILRYERWLRVKRWKDDLPDGASWFSGGVPKSHLHQTGVVGLMAFAAETWRGELCHWSVIAVTPVFFLWNPPWANGVMVGYALLSNLPCIIVQRYNRLRIAAAIQRTKRRNSELRSEANNAVNGPQKRLFPPSP